MNALPIRCPALGSAVVADAFCQRLWEWEGRLTPKTHWRTRQGLCGPLPVCASRPGAFPIARPKVPGRRRERKKRWFRQGEKWRTGCEGRISVVKTPESS